MTYVLGISDQDEAKPKYSQQRFQAFQEYNTDLLADVDSKAARAVVAFCADTTLRLRRQHPAIGKRLDALLKGGNLVFLVDGSFAPRRRRDPADMARQCALQAGEEMQSPHHGESCTLDAVASPASKEYGARNPLAPRLLGSTPLLTSLTAANRARTHR